MEQAENIRFVDMFKDKYKPKKQKTFNPQRFTESAAMHQEEIKYDRYKNKSLLKLR